MTREEFRALAETWQRQTFHFSFWHSISQHPAYQAIVAAGQEAVPFILEELEKDKYPRGWLSALYEITRKNPARRAKTVEEAREAWLTWGRSRGLCK